MRVFIKAARKGLFAVGLGWWSEVVRFLQVLIEEIL